ncbi:MAG TPA: hypothetical protein VFJ58_27875, partial [Armatimonadota bacterium]|nr:hypothetical protein [Armatimonadota bacterium]
DVAPTTTAHRAPGIRGAPALPAEQQSSRTVLETLAEASAPTAGNRAIPSFTTRLTSPKQHEPPGLFTSQPHRPAFTCAAIVCGAVDLPVRRISSQMLFSV